MAGILDKFLALSYAVLAGRAGGQTLKGGTGSGENLNLSPTNHATLGSVRVEQSFAVYDAGFSNSGITLTALAGGNGLFYVSQGGVTKFHAGATVQVLTDLQLGTSGLPCIVQMQNGASAPAAAADVVKYWTQDFAAGDARLYFQTESGGQIILGGGQVRAARFVSTQATGTAPFDVTSQTLVSNLNVQFLNGNASSAFALASHTHSASQVTDFAEAVDDRVFSLLVEAAGIDLVYNDGADTLTITVDATEIAITPSGNLASSNVAAALNELQSDIDTRATTATLNARTKGYVQILKEVPAASSAATAGTLAGGGTSTENLPIHTFPDAAARFHNYLCVLRNYNGGGLTFTIPFAASVNTGNVWWLVAIRRLADDAEDFDAAHSYDWNGVTSAVANVVGEIKYATVSFSDGADMDNWADGELAIVQIVRDGTFGTDTATGDARLLTLLGKES